MISLCTYGRFRTKLFWSNRKISFHVFSTHTKIHIFKNYINTEHILQLINQESNARGNIKEEPKERHHFLTGMSAKLTDLTGGAMTCTRDTTDWTMGHFYKYLQERTTPKTPQTQMLTVSYPWFFFFF